MEMNSNGANKLAERILDDARADAGRVLDDAKAGAQALRSEAQARMEAYSADCAARREAAVAALVDSGKTRASLDGRKAALQKKRLVIDEAFRRAYEGLCALDADARGAICRRLLEAEAAGGETIVPAAADRAAIAAMLGSLPVQGLRLSEQDAPIDGGFLLVGRSYEKDCSFRAILGQLRDNEETNVADLLFG